MSDSTILETSPELSLTPEEYTQNKILNKTVDYIKVAAKKINEENPDISFYNAIEMTEWQHERGYPMLDNSGQPYKTDYDGYTDELLIELARSGDRKAMQIVGTSLLQNGMFEEAEKFLWDASVRGYTSTIAETANIYLIKYHQESEKRLKQDYAIKAFSLLNLALKRGDLSTNFTISMNNHIRFSEEEKADIQLFSVQYYNKLLEDRKNLGLSDFDNTYPQALEQWMSKFIEL